MKINLVRTGVGILVFLGAFAQVSFAEPSTNNLRQIGAEDFLRTVHDRGIVRDSRIPFGALRQALLESANSPELITIRITNSVITRDNDHTVAIPTNAQLNVNLDILNCLIEEANFEHLTFSPASRVWFYNSTFSSEVNFQGTKSLGWVGFDNSTFRKDANFQGTVLLGAASFMSAKFNSGVKFDKALLNRANFSGAEFAWTSSFVDSSITNGSFSTLRIKYYLNLAGATFAGDTTFDDSHFNNVAFSDRGGSFDPSFECRFIGPATFRGCTFTNDVKLDFVKFSDSVRFDDADFCGSVSMDNMKFDRTAYFSQSAFPKRFTARNCKFDGGVQFSNVHFEGETSFERLSGFGLQFTNAIFDGQVRFTSMRAQPSNDSPMAVSHIYLHDCRFKDKVTFDDSDISDLRISGDLSPVVFERDVTFRRCNFHFTTFSEVNFDAPVSFEAAKVRTFSARNVNFKEALDFRHLNSWKSGFDISLSQISIGGPFLMEWDQLNDCKMSFGDFEKNASAAVVWQVLEDAFGRAGNLEGKNNAMYRRLNAERKSPALHLFGRVSNLVSCAFWGFGVRPLRVLGWMLALYVLGFAIYWTQTTQLARKPTGLRDRFWFTANFAWQTSVKLDYGPKNSSTPSFKMITAFHSVLFKVLGFFFLTALANVNPLLNALIRKALVF